MGISLPDDGALPVAGSGAAYSSRAAGINERRLHVAPSATPL